MKANIVLLSIGLLVCSLANGQIKIGDNPQNIDPASILELESNSRVLVITRISTQQMESIVPNPGALIYNTDTQCIHYFDGTQWANLCESAELTFTADPIENALSTIVITRNDDNINLEVAPNSIRTEQIVNGGVNGVDIQDNSIGPNKLADDAVGRDELSENAVGVDALAVDEFSLGDFANTPGFITGADIVSNDPDNAISDNGGAFYDDGVLEADINTNANAIILKEDAANKSNDIALGNSAVLFPTQNAVKTYVDAAVGGSAQTIVSANTPNSIVAGTDGGALFNAVPLQTGIATNATNLTSHIANDDTQITNELITNAVLNGTDLVITEAGTDFTVPLGGLGGGGEVPDNELITNAVLNGTDLVITEAGTDFTVPLGGLGGGSEVPDNELITNAVLNGTDLVITEAGTDFTVPLGGLSANPTATDVTFTPYLSIGSTNTQAAIQDLKDEVDNLTITGGGENPNNELNQTFVVNGANLELTDAGGLLQVPLAQIDTDDQTVDEFALSPANVLSISLIDDGAAPSTVDLAALEESADITANTTLINNHITNDGDTDDQNEIELPDDSGATAGDVLSTDAAGNYSWIANGGIPTGTAGALFFSDGSGGLNDSPTNLFWDSGNNRLGIGTNSPVRALEVVGETRSTSFATPGGSSGLPGYGFSTNSDFDTGMFRAGNNQIGFSTNGTQAVRIDASQNVGIGPAFASGAIGTRLHVDGDIWADGEIRATGVIVELDPAVAVPDYVFQNYFKGHSSLNEEYQFKTLEEIEAFVKKNHHLPGIKSAIQVKEDGFWNLSESNLKNLEKIEELFLHTIAQEKKIEQLQNEKDSLSQEVQALRKDIQQIKAMLKNNKSKK